MVQSLDDLQAKIDSSCRCHLLGDRDEDCCTACTMFSGDATYENDKVVTPCMAYYRLQYAFMRLKCATAAAAVRDSSLPPVPPFPLFGSGVALPASPGGASVGAVGHDVLGADLAPAPACELADNDPVNVARPLSERTVESIIGSVDTAGIHAAICAHDRPRIGDLLACAGIVGNGRRKYDAFIDCLFMDVVNGDYTGSVPEMIQISMGDENFHALRRMEDEDFEERHWRAIADEETQAELRLSAYHALNRFA